MKYYLVKFMCYDELYYSILGIDSGSNIKEYLLDYEDNITKDIIPKSIMDKFFVLRMGSHNSAIEIRLSSEQLVNKLHTIKDSFELKDDKLYFMPECTYIEIIK